MKYIIGWRLYRKDDGMYWYAVGAHWELCGPNKATVFEDLQCASGTPLYGSGCNGVGGDIHEANRLAPGKWMLEPVWNE